MMNDKDVWSAADDIFPPGDGAFRSFFDRAGVRAARLDEKFRVVETNVDFAAEFGCPEPLLLTGQALPELLHPSVRGQVTHQLTRLVEGQRNRFVERVLALRSGGAAFGGELTGFAVYDEVGSFDGLIVLLRPEHGERAAVVVGRKKLLSPMDARVLEGIAAGASTVQLAAVLYLSRGGVEYHVTALLRGMKVRNRSALVSKAYSMGLFCAGSWPPQVLPEYVR